MKIQALSVILACQVAEYKRALKAIKYWEAAAVEDMDKASYVEALRDLQKAEGIADALAEYFKRNKKHSVFLWSKPSESSSKSALAAVGPFRKSSTLWP